MEIAMVIHIFYFFFKTLLKLSGKYLSWSRNHGCSSGYAQEILWIFMNFSFIIVGPNL